MTKTRIVFMGTGEIAIPSLKWLLGPGSNDFFVAGVYTQPDKKVGRKQILTPPEIKVIAEQHGIPVFQPETFRKNEQALAELKALQPDIAVVMAYGQILPQSVIDAPNLACVNLHASLLPRHRGASPIQAAIRDGDAESGITLMHIVKALDAGDMILKSVIPIEPTDTGGSLHDKLAELGPGLLAEGLPLLASDSAPREPQDETAVTVIGKLSREDGRIDWNRPADQIELLIRAYDPWPGTHTTFESEDGKIRQIKIFPHCSTGGSTDQNPGTILSSDNQLIIACGNGSSLILEGHLQLEGRKRLPVGEFLRGFEGNAGDSFS